MRKRSPILALVLLSGCTVNPITGRDQMMAIPVVQSAYAEADFSLSSEAQRIAASRACAQDCASPARVAEFSAHVAFIGAQLEAAARWMSPELFERIGRYSIEVDGDLGIATASSAGGRIVIGAGIAGLKSAHAPTGVPGLAALESGLGGLEPSDIVIAFLLAREMAHVIARHAEENSGASMAVSAIGLLLPGVNVLARFLVSRVSADALRESWVAEQSREADEIALALLRRCGLSALDVSLGMERGLDPRRLPGDGWGEAYRNSASRIARIAFSSMRYTGL